MKVAAQSGTSGPRDYRVVCFIHLNVKYRLQHVLIFTGCTDMTNTRHAEEAVVKNKTEVVVSTSRVVVRWRESQPEQ